MSRPRSNELARRIVLSIMGPYGGGKTDFLLTMPKPLLLLANDPNTKDVVCKVFEVEDVDDLDPDICRLVTIPFPLLGFESREEDVIDEATDSWNTLTDEISDVLNHKAKTQPISVGIDSGSELNQLCILKEFGRTDKIAPAVRVRRMGAVNNDFKGIFRALEKAQVHVGVTHRCKEHWGEVEVRKNGKVEVEERVVPGQYDRIGFKEMGNIVNAEVLTLFDPERGSRLSQKFGMRILRSMIRPGQVGEEYWGRQEVGEEMVRAASFPFLGTCLYPGTSLKDWE